jgi:hypothetical protein
VFGCSAEPAGSAAALVRDSAGIRVVENVAPTWRAGEEWRLEEQPLLDIGGLEGDPDYELFRAVSAVRLRDGRIVIANAGTHELRFYDADGRFLAASGGQGAGPGEFQGLAWVRPFGDDSLVTFDLRQRRLSVFDLQGRFGRSVAVRGGGDAPIRRAVGLFGDGSILVYGSSGIGSGERTGLVRRDVPLFRLTPEGEPLDSLGSFPGAESFVQGFNGGMIVMSRLFGRSSQFAVWGMRLYVAANDTYEIRVLTAKGSLESIVRKRHANLEVTRQDIDTAREGRLRRVEDSEFRERLEGLLRDMPLPATMPAFRDIQVDEIGNLWVEEYNRPGDERPRWSVFDRDGVLFGAIGSPERLRLLHAGEDFVLGRWTDELDVEHVRLYTLIKPRAR